MEFIFWWHHLKKMTNWSKRCISTKYGVFLFVLYTLLGCFGATESVQIEYNFESRKNVLELDRNQPILTVLHYSLSGSELHHFLIFRVMIKSKFSILFIVRNFCLGGGK